MILNAIHEDGKILLLNIQDGNQWNYQDDPILGAISQYYLLISNGDYFDIVTQSGCKSNRSN